MVRICRGWQVIDMPPILKSQLLADVPPEWPLDVFPDIQVALRRDGRKVVVLDDDPTGTQTVHGVPVLTEWSVERLSNELRSDLPCVYVLTNTRAMPLVQAQALNAEIGQNLVQASRQVGREMVLISRSDSTLRGHFPGETDALVAAMSARIDGTLIIPAFMAGLRRTINDVHYVGTMREDGEWLTPAGETEFAQDKAFGYQASNLKAWVAEKSAGRVSADAVGAITLDHIRRGGPDAVMRYLMQMQSNRVCIVNAVDERDLSVAVLGIMRAEQAGRRYLFRTAASFVQWRAGIASRPLLSRADLLRDNGVDADVKTGGLILVGSYVPKTSAQLAALLQRCATGNLYALEIEATRLIDTDTCAAEIARVVQQADLQLQQGRDVVIYTSRALISGMSAADNLMIGGRVSAGLVQVVQQLSLRPQELRPQELRPQSLRPRYVLAKGGITSSDIATIGLGVRRAMVLGQILPGVPVWQLGAETQWPGMPYIVFPGNVGGEQALLDVVTNLAQGI